MSQRLTRTELSWLLTQEARSAAEKLRQGVGLSQPPEAIMPPPPEEGSGGVESTLNKLDDAVNMLASLHGQQSARGRRGKIDIAALVWEIAPEARVQIEMGAGCTVFGDESELRRMIFVLIGQSGDPMGAKAVEMSVRREGDQVRLSVGLGPDKSSTFETERQWLSRMAVRYGGQLKLEGSTQILSLPADVDSRQREVEDLKRELAAAQAQGEAYARELAQFFSQSGEAAPPVVRASSTPARPSQKPTSSDSVVVLVAAARTLATRLRGIHAAINRDIAPLRDRSDEVGDIAASAGRHVTAASEIISDLARLGNCPVGELPAVVDLADMLRTVVRENAARAARREVTVNVDLPDQAEAVVPAGALTVLLNALLDHALDASPTGGSVELSVERTDQATQICFDDDGPRISANAKVAVMSRDFEAMAGDRPLGMSLIVAHALAGHHKLLLEIEDAPKGGARVRLKVPHS